MIESKVTELKQWNTFKLDDKGNYEVYRGIDRNYYSKWIGFRLIDEGKIFEEVDKAVVDFYLTYYYYQLKLDLIEDELLEFVILDFATQNGKRKTIEKLERVCGLEVTGKPTTKLMTYMHQHKGFLFPYIILEFLEFYYYTEKLLQGGFLLKAYRQLVKHKANHKSDSQ